MFLRCLNRKNCPGSESIPVAQALGRVTAAPVYAKLSSPRFHTAAMDGFAVLARNTFGAGPGREVRLRINSEAWSVNTGLPMPAGTDSVIMIENVHFIDDNEFEIDQGLVPWEHVRRVGEDFVASEMILPGRHLISPYDQGALLAGGINTVEVVERPRVLIIPTGNELVPYRDADEIGKMPGRTVEFNSVVLSSLVEQVGGVVETHEIVRDEFELVKAAVLEGVRSDAHVVVINAGSSAGSEDYTAAAISELGEVLVHGVAMMPGKPTVLGMVEGKPVIGSPGYPVSCVFSFEVFGVPLIEAMLGVPGSRRPIITAVSARKITSKLGREEFFRVKLGKVGDRIIAAPLPRGAGSITTLTRADGILRIPSRSEGIDQGSLVQVELLKQAAQIDRTVVVIGSHDLTLDVLTDELIHYNVFLSSSHVGSLGGLLALKSRSAHLATSHLLDPNTGVYNWTYLRRYIPDIPVRLIHGVMREQGFIVRKGNPKSIKGFDDLVRSDVIFVNRQAGAGTRVLLDYNLEFAGIDPHKIVGYHTDEYTHLGVAIAVLSGVADVGMGVLAAAQALDLDFIPVATEQYDLVIPEEFFNTEIIQFVLATLRSDSFKKRVVALGGYSVDRTGEEVSPPG